MLEDLNQNEQDFARIHIVINPVPDHATTRSQCCICSLTDGVKCFGSHSAGVDVDSSSVLAKVGLRRCALSPSLAKSDTISICCSSSPFGAIHDFAMQTTMESMMSRTLGIREEDEERVSTDQHFAASGFAGKSLGSCVHHLSATPQVEHRYLWRHVGITVSVL
jgi:hypothetical protein